MKTESMKTEYSITIINTLAKALDAAEAENRKLNDQITTLKTMLENVERQRDAAETENIHLHKEIVFRDKTTAELEARLEQQAQSSDTPAQVVFWNRPEQFGLPPGYTINNPDNLSPDQIGEGYRIATTADDTNLPHELFKGNKLWGSACCFRGTFAEYPNSTYRVPADRPLQPLENNKP